MLRLNLQFHSAPGSLSALREDTFQNLQLNVGMFVKNFDYENIQDAGELLEAIEDELESGDELLGVTYGGGNFSVSREMRNPQIDGLRYRYKGGSFVDSADPYLSTTLKECTPQNFAAGFGGEVTTSGKKATVRMPTAIKPSAYLTNLCWIGELSGGQMVMIVLYNALNTADFTFTFQDKGEGSQGVEFHGCQSDVKDYDYAPFEVIFLYPDGDMGALEVTSAAGTNVGQTAITVDHTLTSGQKFVYKIGNSAPSVVYNEVPDYSWTEWNGSSALDVGAANNGKKITVAVLSSAGRAIMSGNATLVVKTT